MVRKCSAVDCGWPLSAGCRVSSPHFFGAIGGPQSRGVESAKQQPPKSTRAYPYPDNTSELSLLVKALDDPDPGWRLRAMYRISEAYRTGEVRVADKAAVESLMKVTRDLDGHVRLAAVKVIGEIGPQAATAVPTVVPAVIELFRAAEKEGLPREPRQDTLPFDTQKACLQTLRAWKRSLTAVDFLTAVLRGAKTGPTKPLKYGSFRLEACVELAKAGPNAKSSVPGLLDVVKMAARTLDANSSIYSQAVYTLKEIGDERALPVLRKHRKGEGLRGKEHNIAEVRKERYRLAKYRAGETKTERAQKRSGNAPTPSPESVPKFGRFSCFSRLQISTGWMRIFRKQLRTKRIGGSGRRNNWRRRSRTRPLTSADLGVEEKRATGEAYGGHCRQGDAWPAFR